MQDPPDPSPAAADAAAALEAGVSGLVDVAASVMALSGPLKEATLGYRQQLVDSGVGAEFADRMACDFHGLAYDMVRAGLRRPNVKDPS